MLLTEKVKCSRWHESILKSKLSRKSREKAVVDNKK